VDAIASWRATWRRWSGQRPVKVREEEGLRARIKEVLRIAGPEPFRQHLLFVYLVLREPLWPLAFAVADAQRETPLTEDEALYIAREWSVA
jgi:hypothetical protein